MSTLASTAAAIVDQPVPNRVTHITPPSAAVIAKDNFNLGIMAAIVIAAAAVCFWAKHPVPGYILGGLGLVLIVSLFTKKSDVGQCPYCMTQFRETVSVKDGLLHCEHCANIHRSRTT